jgi:hypothetical protein
LLREKTIAPFLPLIPETRNLRRFLVSGINGKNVAMGFFSDHMLYLFIDRSSKPVYTLLDFLHVFCSPHIIDTFWCPPVYGQSSLSEGKKRKMEFISIT